MQMEMKDMENDRIDWRETFEGNEEWERRRIWNEAEEKWAEKVKNERVKKILGRLIGSFSTAYTSFAAFW